MKPISNLEKSILDYFAYQNILAWKNPSVGIYDEKRKSFRKPKNTMLGTPDVFFLINGSMCAAELKTTDYMSREQTLFMVKFILSGGFYCIAKSLDDLIDTLKFYHFYLDEQNLFMNEMRVPVIRELTLNTYNENKYIPNANLICNLKDERFTFNDYSKINLFLNIFGKYTYKILYL